MITKYDWPFYENVQGDNGTFSMEDLYQAFKERLIKEVVAKEPDVVTDKVWDGIHHCKYGKTIPLVNKEQS